MNIYCTELLLQLAMGLPKQWDVLFPLVDAVWYCVLNYSMIILFFTCRHGGIGVDGTVSCHSKKVLGLIPRWDRAFLCAVCMLPWLCGFPPGALVSPAIIKNMLREYPVGVPDPMHWLWSFGTAHWLPTASQKRMGEMQRTHFTVHYVFVTSNVDLNSKENITVSPPQQKRKSSKKKFPPSNHVRNAASFLF